VSLTLQAENLCHRFGKISLFSDLSFALGKGDVLVIAGPNGSGKSTLIRILSGFLNPTMGEVSITEDGKTFGPRHCFHVIGMCTPEMRLYEELTGWENLDFFARLRGIKDAPDRLKQALSFAGLEQARHRRVKVYSSGMKQRLKLLLAFFHAPPILYLDEPSSNLDEDGIKLVSEIIQSQHEQGITVIATNDSSEYEYGNKKISLAP
jgi:heme exporter protein A